MLSGFEKLGCCLGRSLSALFFAWNLQWTTVKLRKLFLLYERLLFAWRLSICCSPNLWALGGWFIGSTSQKLTCTWFGNVCRLKTGSLLGIERSAESERATCSTSWTLLVCRKCGGRRLVCDLLSLFAFGLALVRLCRQNTLAIWLSLSPQGSLESLPVFLFPFEQLLRASTT